MEQRRGRRVAAVAGSNAQRAGDFVQMIPDRPVWRWGRVKCLGGRCAIVCDSVLGTPVQAANDRRGCSRRRAIEGGDKGGCGLGPRRKAASL